MSGYYPDDFSSRAFHEYWDEKLDDHEGETCPECNHHFCICGDPAENEQREVA